MAIVRDLAGLKDVVSLSYVDDARDARGWAFRERRAAEGHRGSAAARHAEAGRHRGGRRDHQCAGRRLTQTPELRAAQDTLPDVLSALRVPALVPPPTWNGRAGRAELPTEQG
ncbi:hypothetical protein [Acrocarpospora sp. B8E8]|uniref:hypothetical protein n=1 Tax=Acrocarpospora sp. B8E8 TaxID=3153572 RepID=UPI00325E9564